MEVKYNVLSDRLQISLHPIKGNDHVNIRGSMTHLICTTPASAIIYKINTIASYELPFISYKVYSITLM